jgi:hypothetical protein
MSELSGLPPEAWRRRRVRTRGVAEFFDISIPEVRRRLKAGLLPQPDRPGGRQMSWQLGVLVDFSDQMKKKSA